MPMPFSLKKCTAFKKVFNIENFYLKYKKPIICCKNAKRPEEWCLKNTHSLNIAINYFFKIIRQK